MAVTLAPVIYFPPAPLQVGPKAGSNFRDGQLFIVTGNQDRDSLRRDRLDIVVGKHA